MGWIRRIKRRLRYSPVSYWEDHGIIEVSCRELSLAVLGGVDFGIAGFSVTSPLLGFLLKL